MDVVPEKLTNGEPLSVAELLECLPALKEVPATLLEKYALGAVVRRRFRAGDIVCEEGEFGSTAFYLVSGHVEIYLANPMAAVRTRPGGGILSFFKRMTSFLAPGGQGSTDSTLEQGFIPIDASVDLPRTTPLAYLGPGELFGEMTCRTFQPRSATVRAAEDCVLVEMLRVILDMLVGTRDPDAETKATTKVRAPTFKGTSFKKHLDDQYRERSLITHLRGVPLFATLDFEFFTFLKERAELVSCNKGEVICRQGDPAEAFYLIRTGLVRVAQAMPGGEMVRTYLKRGEYFGEIGLLFDQERNATCSALDAVDLVKIDRECFQLMLEKFPVVRATLEHVARARVAAAKERKIPVGLQLDEFLNQGLFEAQNLLLIDLDHCTRCDACVNACSDAHDGISRLIRDGLRYDKYLVATACRSCRDPLCMTQCPVGSIRRKETLEIIIEDWCIGCSKCAELCPYGNINMHSFDVMKEVAAAPAKPPAGAKTAPGPAAKPAPKPAAAPAAALKAAAETASLQPGIENGPKAVGTLEVRAAATPAAGRAAAPAGRDVQPAPEPAAVATAAKEGAAETAPATGDGSNIPAPVQEPGPEANAAANPAPAKEPVAVAAERASALLNGPAAPATVPEPKPRPAVPAAKPAEGAPALAKGPAAPAPAQEPKPKPAPAAKEAKPAPPKEPAPAAAKPSAPAKPAGKKVRKKVTVSKATTCDLCTQLSEPSCVYACPHEAAMRVEPTKFLAEQIGHRASGKQRTLGWLNKAGGNRTTH